MKTQMSMETRVHLSADPVNKDMQTAGMMPQHWCDACAKQTWVVTLEEAVEIAGISPGCYSMRAGKALMMRHIHAVTTATGIPLICLKSLFHCIFSACEKDA